MPQNTKDSSGGKSQPVKKTGTKGGTNAGEGKADKDATAPVGSQNKGRKKTTP